MPWIMDGLEDFPDTLTVADELEAKSRQYFDAVSDALRQGTLYARSNARYTVSRLLAKLLDRDNPYNPMSIDNAAEVLEVYQSIFNHTNPGEVIDRYLDEWITKDRSELLKQVAKIYPLIHHKNKHDWANRLLGYQGNKLVRAAMTETLLRHGTEAEQNIVHKYVRAVTRDWVEKSEACSGGRSWMVEYCKYGVYYDVVDMYRMNANWDHIEFVWDITEVGTSTPLCTHCDKIYEDCECDRCGNCGATDCECTSCENCGEYDEDGHCSTCDRCSSCCNCYYCDSCHTTCNPDDESQCSTCEHCDSCCECYECEYCDEKVDPDSCGKCPHCENCDDHCTCEWCTTCQVRTQDCDCTERCGYCETWNPERVPHLHESYCTFYNPAPLELVEEGELVVG